MDSLKLMVPTYLAERFPEEVATGRREDFGEPCVPVLVQRAGGVRVVLGSHEWEDVDKPDVHIERRPHGWAIFLHAVGGGDPSGYVYFLDDGRSFLVPEDGGGATPVIEVLKPGATVREVDWGADRSVGYRSAAPFRRGQ